MRPHTESSPLCPATYLRKCSFSAKHGHLNVNNVQLRGRYHLAPPWFKPRSQKNRVLGMDGADTLP